MKYHARINCFATQFFFLLYWRVCLSLGAPDMVVGLFKIFKSVLDRFSL